MKKERIKPKYSILSNAAFLLRIMAKAYPLLVVCIVLEIIGSVALPYVTLFIPKVSIELVTHGASMHECLVTLGTLGAAIIACSVLKSFGNGKYFMFNSMRTVYMLRLFRQWLSCDYDRIERAEGQTKYQRALGSILPGDESGASRLISKGIQFIVALCSFFLYAELIARLHPLMAAVLIFLSAVNFLTQQHAQHYFARRRNEKARYEKRLDYVEETSEDARWGKDIRIYGMSGWLKNVRNLLLNQEKKFMYQVLNRFFAADTAFAFTVLLRDFGAYGYLIWSVSAGRISVADFALYFGAVTGFSAFVTNLVNCYSALTGANLKVNDLRAFLDDTDAPEPKHPAALPNMQTMRIEFDHVSFAYTPDGEKVLDDFCLSIEPGEKVALVGVNGAGKTTIVKLLCGLYQPDSGVIRIGGTDIRQYRKKDLFSLFSPVFQDLFLLPATLAENVSCQPLKETDLIQVRSCLKKAGLWEAIAAYPAKEKSPMLREIEEGIVLSGGQTQKLLMARALYKNAPILVLDEPTAALDPISESETYESFHALAKDKTAVYISHRLASTRFCDRIALLSHGRITEQGTHEALLRQNGEYARMFEIQSHYYREEATIDA